jgi:hypothetical protein
LDPIETSAADHYHQAHQFFLKRIGSVAL